MRAHGYIERPPFRPDWRCVDFADTQCYRGFDWVPGMTEAEEKHLAERTLVALLENQNSLAAATADLQSRIETLVLMVKQRVYRPVLEIGFQTMGRTPAVEKFLTEFLDHALLLKDPLLLAIEQGSIKLPAYKTPQMDRSMYSLCVLEGSVQASREQNFELHASYSEHCYLVEQLLELLTYTPRDTKGLACRLLPFKRVPQHQLPTNSKAACAWPAERLSPLFLFRDPSQMTRADLGPVEASCCFTISDDLQSDWQLSLKAAPAHCSLQSHVSSGTASDDGSVCDYGPGYAFTSAAMSWVQGSSPASQRPSSAAHAQPSTSTSLPKQPKGSFLSRAAARVKGAVCAVVSWCVSAVKKVASAAVHSWL